MNARGQLPRLPVRRESRNGTVPAWRSAPDYAVLDFPAILRRRCNGETQFVAEGPLGLLAEALLCLEHATRNEFTIDFAFLPSGNDGTQETGK